MTQALVIMAKAPLPTMVKTRFSPQISPEVASFLYEQFLLDKIDQVREIDSADKIIAFTPENARAYFMAIRPVGFELVLQEGTGLGERLFNIMCGLFENGFDRIVILDSDTPHLPTDYIRDGLERMDKSDVVIGPCEDGGYYLIGMRVPAGILFTDVPWSTSEVAAVTVDRAIGAGLTVSMLPEWYDLDRADDIRRLRVEAENGDMRCRNGFLCRHTLAALARLEL